MKFTFLIDGEQTKHKVDALRVVAHTENKGDPNWVDITLKGHWDEEAAMLKDLRPYRLHVEKKNAYRFPIGATVLQVMVIVGEDGRVVEGTRLESERPSQGGP